ncbi:MAG: putative baseplate assembly protein [Ferruginibacter sp.]
METQFYCKNRDRWKKVSATSNMINGIDYLEVSSIDQKKLTLFFLHNLPGQTNGRPANPPLTTNNIFIEGGVRIKNITVTKVTSLNNVLTIEVDAAGDFSTYTLKVGSSSTNKDNPPDGFDQQLSSIDFSFKINCPNEFDCNTETVCPPGNTEEPALDYLAKDYASFNRLMLDRLSSIMPGWTERHAADLEIALIEMLAYIGDHLSYYQDAVVTEAYLNTARRRISLKRHARLLDYHVHDGCNARVWVQIEVEKGSNADGLPLEKRTRLMTNGTGNSYAIRTTDTERFINERDPIVFETMHDIALNSSHNMISFYTWEDSDCCLPAGTTAASLIDDGFISIKKGDVLILEELYGPSGKKADADPAHRHAVRIRKATGGITDNLTGTKVINIEWYEEDALPFSLCLTSPEENEDDVLPINEKAVARGNIVLADYGYTRKNERLNPPTAGGKLYYPSLPATDNTVAVSYNHEFAKSMAAKVTVLQNPHDALPVVNLFDGQEIWNAKQDLLGSDRFASEFVVETEQDGTSYLRFGDDKSGKKPLSGFQPRATYRLGNGKAGNIGAGAINTIASNVSGITMVRNPLAASGGREAESMEEIRQFAPRAFRTQERAVTATDYVEKTALHPEVQKAAAKFYWTGSWYTVYIIIDRKGGREIDAAFKQTISKHLEQYRMAGYDLEIRAPRFVPLYITMNVCVKEGYFASEIKKRLLQVFSKSELGDGTIGFFHPDNFSFGQPIYLSAIYKTAMEIDGVASVEIKEFKRWAKKAGKEIKDGLLKPSELEIIRLDNDPNFPENGKIDFTMLAGL